MIHNNEIKDALEKLEREIKSIHDELKALNTRVDELDRGTDLLYEEMVERFESLEQTSHSHRDLEEILAL